MAESGAVRHRLYIVNTSLPMGMMLTPNASNVSIRESKVYNRTRTVGGWTFEHWGDHPGNMTVSGITFTAKPRTRVLLETYVRLMRSLYKLDKVNIGEMIGKLSPNTTVAKAFTSGTVTARQLRTLAQTTIFYNYNMYSGFFTDFTLTEDATRPDIYIYNFTYLITGSVEDYMRDKLAGLMFSTTGKIVSDIKSLIGKSKNVSGTLPPTRRIDTIPPVPRDVTGGIL